MLTVCLSPTLKFRGRVSSGRNPERAASSSDDDRGDAARDLPKADNLAGLLWDLAQRAPRMNDPDAAADEDWVEDDLRIERVEPGAL